MTNHIRTLLVNLPQSVALQYSAVYTPPDFGPVAVPLQLQPVESLLFAGQPVQERVALVDLLLPLLHSGELDPVMRRLDPWVTYDYHNLSTDYRKLSTVAGVTQQTITGLPVAMLLRRVLSSSVPSTAFNQLFAETHPSVTDLRDVWTQADEGAARVAALCISYAYQLDAVRRGRL